MICPRCSVAEIGASGACELCGFVPDGAVAVAEPHPDATDGLARAQLAHQFRIDVLLGTGAASAVYLAREQESAGHIVLKVLPRKTGHPELDARFRDAIAAAEQLDHPHLVPVLRRGETDSLLWYTMEHRRARPLREALRSGQRLDYKACLRLVTQIAGALDYLHRRGATHGRLKPENVLVDAEQWVYVCDALVSRAIAEAPADAAATPYQAPEEKLGFAGPSSDQFALAILIFEMLTGTTPNASGPGATDIRGALVALRPDLPPHVGFALARATQPRPNDRYLAILDFVTALESSASLLVDARPSGRASDVILSIPDWKPPPKERPRWLIPAGIGVVVLFAGGLAVALWPQRDNGTGLTLPPPAVTAAPQAPAVGPADRTGPLPPAPEPRPIGVPLGRLVPPTITDTRRDRGSRRASATTSETAAPATQAAAPASAPAPAPAAAPAADAGHLFINASPWGQVFLDGQAIGNTPKANLSVSAGSHTIRVVRDGFEPVERTVRVGAGETVRVTDIVLTPRQ